MVDVSLKSGTKGRFEITLDDQLLFSKAKLGRFPRDGEIVALMRASLGPPLDWR